MAAFVSSVILPSNVTLNLLTPSSPHLPLVKEIVVNSFGRETITSQLCPSPNTGKLPRSYSAVTPEGVVVGYVCLKKHFKAGRDAVCVLHTLCVKPNLRGQGLGGAIVRLLV